MQIKAHNNIKKEKHKAHFKRTQKHKKKKLMILYMHYMHGEQSHL